MIEQLKEALTINNKVIWIKTNQEKEVFAETINLLLSLGILNIYTWSIIDSVQEVKISDGYCEYNAVKQNTNSPYGILRFIEEISNDYTDSALIMKDYGECLSNTAYKRLIKEVTETIKNNRRYVPIIFIDNGFDIPQDLSDKITLINTKMPSKRNIEDLLNTYESINEVAINKKEETINALYGLSKKEIINILDISFYRYNCVNLDVIKDKKIDLINKTNLLKYKIPVNTINDIGGNNNFKRWFEEMKLCFSDDARKYNIDYPKGYLALGIPGCSKTLFAEAIANELNQPLLILDMSKLLSYRVGESEQKASRAIELIESCAPCVLLIDEIEKSLGGVNSSNNSDSGVLARIFGKILEMLNDNTKGVFTIMTSNNIQELPPELTRAGRLDAIWYFSIPNKEERKEIANIHFAKRGYTNINNKVINEIVNKTENYTGAEIEQVIKNIIKKEYINKKDNDIIITNKYIESSKEDVIPIYESSKERIKILEYWAKGRALYATKNNKDINNNYDDDDGIVIV